MIEAILTEILQSPQAVRWDDIGSLENAKKSVNEAVIWPLRRPDLFTACRLLRVFLFSITSLFH